MKTGESKLPGANMADRLRLAALVAGRSLGVTARAVLAPARAVARWRMRSPERLLIAPQDIRTADATRAEDIYAGYFAFGGRIVNTQGRSPFDLHAPSLEWERALNGFGWLRHLRAADTALARVNARALVNDYLAKRGRAQNSGVNDPETTARRILSWLSQSTLLLEGADSDFYDRFLRALARDAGQLQHGFGTTSSTARMVAAIALAEYAMCADTPQRYQARATAQLAAAIEEQILPDGGHIGRNPRTLVDLLLDFLPLRQAYIARGVAAPAALLNAIDRIIPAVRLLRHGDGSLALFNGMGVTAPDRVAIVLAYDDARGQPLTSAPHSGYQRLEAGESVVIVDCGRPPPRALSRDAHAGCLAFEFSAGVDRIVVNCGTPARGGAATREATRQTAAHSTLVIDDMSSCRFAPDIGIERVVAGLIVAGPKLVEARRTELDDGALLEMSHDGYARRFGLTHERKLGLKADGTQLVGEDRLVAAAQEGQLQADAYAVRFHIHPAVALSLGEDGTSVELDLPGGARWLFDAGGLPVAIEESAFFASPDGARASEQIVIHGAATAPVELTWAFTRLDD